MSEIAVPVQPDLEEAISAALDASSRIRAVFGERFGAELIEGAERPFLTYYLGGGYRPVELWLEATPITFDVWGDQDAEVITSAAAREAESVVLGLRGVYASAVITGVQPILGVRPQADPASPERARYLFEVRLFSHPLKG